MLRISATFRITAGLACLAASIVLAAKTVGVVPDRQSAVLDGRKSLCEAVAINSSLFASRGSLGQLEVSLKAICNRNDDILSAGVRRRDGNLLVEIGAHEQNWTTGAANASTASHVFVPVVTGDETWGHVELRFRPLESKGVIGWFNRPLTRLVVFIALVSGLVYYFYLRKMLQHLDPSKVVPDRVRTALDTLAEGLVVVDRRERIVLANQAFATVVGRTPTDLQGTSVTNLPWVQSHDHDGDYPWMVAINDGLTQKGVSLGLQQGKDRRVFMVSATPILGDDGVYRGALASFEDITQIEMNRAELRKMLHELGESRDEIHRKNIELEILAKIDPLTECLNRRAFFGEFERHWNSSRNSQSPLSCMMVDIDHFKSINDNHGHSVGDQVLEQVAAELRDSRRSGELVCRYGGEEFCILLPDVDLDAALEAAEGCRRQIERLEFPNLQVTTSIGISCISLGAAESGELLEQADAALYAAKRGGRNKVVSWHEIPRDDNEDDALVGHGDSPSISTVPFPAVSALITTLSFRDVATAEHSRRVADLCVEVGRRLMSVGELYILEMAALLHDIGKIGVPDAILLKPGPLTDAEWRVMRTHDRIGVEIIRSTFVCSELTEIIRTHHAFFGQRTGNNDLPTGIDIPLGGRILTICDAYDAMVSDRVYRRGRDPEAAFAELRRCAGSQFDPALVEHFIDAICHRDTTPKTSLPEVSKESALQIGVEIERLALAVDHCDTDELHSLAKHLRVTATRAGVAKIADVAAELESLAHDETDLTELVECTKDLLDICRATQGAFLNTEASAD